MNRRLCSVAVVLIGSFALSASVAQRLDAQQLRMGEIRRIGERVAELVDSQYVFPDRRSRIAGRIRSRLRAGAYDDLTNPDSLAAVLTRDLRSASGDRHLYVEHLGDADRHAHAETDWDAWAQRERIEERRKNFGFTEARVLDGNVGYLRIVEFMHPDRGYGTAASAMRLLENTESMIIDVRGNGGGYGGLMDLILSYYFEPAPTHISTTYTSDRSAIPMMAHTLPFVPGRRRVGEPLYILIDGKTGSAAEFFAYTLQAFEKATVVGEPSAGAAHRNSYFDVDERFRVSISTGAPVNPITGTNWEGAGVQPTVVAPADQALRTAHRLAAERLLETAEKDDRARLEELIRRVGGTADE